MRSFKSIIDQHYPILYKIGKAYSEDSFDFEDLYQEMLIQIWQSLKNFKAQSKLSTWIYKVALNTALTYKRRNYRKEQFVQEEMYKDLAEYNVQGQEHSQEERQIEMLYQAIKELNKDERAIILLHLEGKKYEEMAEITGLKVSHIGVKLLRIKRKLLEVLKLKGYERV
ncbi:MAG: RNA polymerase sigma factor [Candidatus Cyclobacteriaceae bacterium M3_2C_046]